ncbi:MAG: response regulator [Nitrospirae bacterium]|nr:response regulator [Nitrospirota bacterium]MBF0541742.1 response regulator [Nitrospirota bacterium]
MSQIKVMLIDDELEFTSIFSERLILRNFDVIAVNKVEDAFTKLRETLPDVILLDLKMPGMNGIEMLKIMRRFDPTIEIIIITGHALGLDKEEAVSMGAFDRLLKPLDINEVIKTIEQAYKKKNLEQRFLKNNTL